MIFQRVSLRGSDYAYRVSYNAACRNIQSNDEVHARTFLTANISNGDTGRCRERIPARKNNRSSVIRILRWILKTAEIVMIRV